MRSGQSCLPLERCHRVRPAFVGYRLGLLISPQAIRQPQRPRAGRLGPRCCTRCKMKRCTCHYGSLMHIASALITVPRCNRFVTMLIRCSLCIRRSARASWYPLLRRQPFYYLPSPTSISWPTIPLSSMYRYSRSNMQTTLPSQPFETQAGRFCSPKLCKRPKIWL